MKKYNGMNNEEIARLLNEEIDDVKARVDSVDRQNSQYATKTAERISKFRKDMSDRLDSLSGQVDNNSQVIHGRVKREGSETRSHVTAEHATTRDHVSAEHEATRRHVSNEVGLLSRQIDALGGRSISEIVIEVLVFAAFAVIAWCVLDSHVLEHFARQYMDASGNLIADWDTNGKLIVSSMDANSRFIAYAILAAFSAAFGFVGAYFVNVLFEGAYARRCRH